MAALQRGSLGGQRWELLGQAVLRLRTPQAQEARELLTLQCYGEPRARQLRCRLLLHPQLTDTIEIPVNHPKILLYQGAINQSRGIPQAILATKYLDDVIFKIAGDGPKIKEYKDLVEKENLQNKVEFLGKLVPTDLRKVTRTADVAVSIEENGGVSYLYSLPNKVADCIQARVPLVLINFPEMMRVYDQFKVGEIVENHEPKNLAKKIQTILDHGRAYYQPELEKAAEELCWEKEESKIIDRFKKVEDENF